MEIYKVAKIPVRIDGLWYGIFVSTTAMQPTAMYRSKTYAMKWLEIYRTEWPDCHVSEVYVIGTDEESPCTKS